MCGCLQIITISIRYFLAFCYHFFFLPFFFFLDFQSLFSLELKKCFICQDIASAIDEEDVTKFTDVVKEFDSMTPLVSICDVTLHYKL